MAKETTPKAKTVEMFCANEQELKAHTVDIDSNGEVVLTCTGKDCGRFVKLPATTTAKSLKAFIEEHQYQNEGQITQASIEERKADLLKNLGI